MEGAQIFLALLCGRKFWGFSSSPVQESVSVGLKCFLRKISTLSTGSSMPVAMFVLLIILHQYLELSVSRYKQRTIKMYARKKKRQSFY